MIKQLKRVELPEDLIWWFHPDFNAIDPMHDNDEERGYTTEEWEQLQANGNIDISIDTSVGLEEIDLDAKGEWKEYIPTPPTPEHFLIASFDTEHQDYAVLWWAKERLPISVQQSLKEVS